MIHMVYFSLHLEIKQQLQHDIVLVLFLVHLDVFLETARAVPGFLSRPLRKWKRKLCSPKGGAHSLLWWSLKTLDRLLISTMRCPFRNAEAKSDGRVGERHRCCQYWEPCYVLQAQSPDTTMRMLPDAVHLASCPFRWKQFDLFIALSAAIYFSGNSLFICLNQVIKGLTTYWCGGEDEN